MTADQIVRFKRHGLQGVRTDGLRMFAEVAECQKRVVAHIADDVFVVGVEGDQSAAIKARIALADGNHMAQTLEDLTGSGRAVMALVVQLLIVTRTVCPAAVVALIAVLRPVVIIERTHFVTQVNQRQTAGTQGDAVQKFDAVNGIWVILSQTDQCCGCTADAAVACVWVVLER